MQTLDTRDLNDRLDELADLRDCYNTAAETVREAEAELAAAKEALAAVDPASEDDLEDAETLVEGCEEALAEAQESLDAAKEDFGDDEREELAELESLKAQISEWEYGATLIPCLDFDAYAYELAEDTGSVSSDQLSQWPFTCIDWARAARELAMDYSQATYKGHDYYVRS
jgi:hypothetical protein